MNLLKLNNGYSIYTIANRAATIYLVKAGNINILVDTGSRKNIERTIEIINQLKEPGKIDYLLFTHTHHDHCLNARLFSEIYDPKVIVGEAEADYLLNGFSPIPGGTVPWSRFIVMIGRSMKDSYFSFKGIKSHIRVSKELDIPDCDVTVIPTPGHSTGSLSVIVNNEIAIVGDTMFGLFRKKIFPPFADDQPELLRSWKKLISYQCRLYLPSHGAKIGLVTLEKEYLKYRSIIPDTEEN